MQVERYRTRGHTLLRTLSKTCTVTIACKQRSTEQDEHVEHEDEDEYKVKQSRETMDTKLSKTKNNYEEIVRQKIQAVP